MARILNAVINIVMVLIAMVVTDLQFGLLMVAASLLLLLFAIALRGPVRYWLRTYRRFSAQLNAKLAEFLSGMAVIRVFGLEAWTQKSFDACANDMLRSGIMIMNWNSFIRPITLLLCSLPTLLILWVGGERVLLGAMTLGAFVAFVRFSERFISPIRMISQEIQNIQEALVSSERVRRMLAEPEERDSLGPDGTATPTLLGDVRYDDVWMSYGGDPVLKGVSFVAKRGMKVALVGATGSGKSSTINLLPRLYPFQRGKIELDGTPIEVIAREHLRAQLGYVSQDVIVFSGTIRANLLAALPEARRNDADIDTVVLAACRKTGLADIVARLPEGLDHKVLEGGENLSMGERQLIAFTRMLLRDPCILILDEATANIDERCEQLIQTATAEVMAGRTSFVIAHRLSTIVQCDLILVFQGGQIVERGTHAELMSLGGVYAGLAARQLSVVNA
jgi:ABC-type multidrug transport system fused ATPase/permease subunit